MPHIRFFLHGLNGRLSFRVLRYVVLCSIFFTLLTSLLQLYASYRRDIARIHENLRFVEENYLPFLATSVYKVDKAQLRLQLQGLLQFQDIEYVEVSDLADAAAFTIAVGNPHGRRDVVRRWQLDYRRPSGAPIPIGRLTMTASFHGVYQRLWRQAAVILSTTAVQTFLTVFVIMVIIQVLITRHLMTMAHYAEQLDLHTLHRPLVLHRAPSGVAQPDELDCVATAINDLRLRLQQDIAERERAEHALQTYQEHLEELVKERTAELRIANAAAEAARQSAENANRAKSAFLASMSHELRTPLNGILGYAQLLQRDQTLPVKQREQSAIIQRSGEHLLTLINDILDLAKIEAGKIELHPAPLHLSDLINDVQVMIALKAEQKGLRFHVEQAGDVPHFVEGDEYRLRQILLNLLGNAIKFTERGGVALRVFIPLPAGGEIFLRFAVEDTGVGIAPDDLARLFMPFQQVGEVARQAQGTGLGLAISRHLAALMGGTLTVTSAVGVGSTFSLDVALPEVAATDAKRAERRRIVGLRGPAPTILVVDDHAENRHILVELLTPVGCRVLEAENGRDALQQMIRAHPAAMITDLRMPEMDGLTLIQRIRALPEFQDVIIIASSASVYEEDRQRSLTAGSQAFLPKPVDMETLCDQLEQLGVAQWQYQETAAPPDAAGTLSSLAGMTEAWRAACYQAVVEADFNAVARLIDQIRPEHPSVADALNDLLNQYRFDVLESLLTDSQGGNVRG